MSDLCEIRFSESRKNGGFTEATLTLKPDGTGENAKKSKYDGPEVYKSIKEVDKETVNPKLSKKSDSGKSDFT